MLLDPQLLLSSEIQPLGVGGRFEKVQKVSEKVQNVSKIYKFYSISFIFHVILNIVDDSRS